MIYLLLAAGVFMGWSLGTNDAANAFGTAVSTGVIKYRTAIIIIAVMVIAGAFLMGDGNIGKVNDLAVINDVSASEEKVAEAEAADLASGTDAAMKELRLKSALKAFIVFTCAAITVFIMSYLGFPVSANQSITGAIVGWGLFHANYGDPSVRGVALGKLGQFASTWLLNPLGAGIISFVLVWFVTKFLEEKITKAKSYKKIITLGYLAAGAFSAFSIGMNSSANVTALYYDFTAKGANLLTNAQLTATIGGIAIAVGVLTYSKRVMMTVGSAIADITEVSGFVVIIAMALTIVIMGTWMGIPVSTSQAVVGAVVGAGLVKGAKHVHFGVFKNIAIAWVSSPTAAGLLTWLVALATQGYFA